jgi:hypothetical protein
MPSTLVFAIFFLGKEGDHRYGADEIVIERSQAECQTIHNLRSAVAEMKTARRLAGLLRGFRALG